MQIEQQAPALSPEERYLARHALGLDNRPGGRSYRNRYFVCGRSGVWKIWNGLVERALADCSEDGKCFSLTRAGAELALEAGESLDPEDFPEKD